MIYSKPIEVSKIFTGLEFIIDFHQIEKSDFAKELGITKQQLNSWIRGTRPIPKKWSKLLAEKYQVEEDILSKTLDQEDELALFKHLLLLKNVPPEEAEEKTNVMKLVQKRLDLHTDNVERLTNLLLMLHKAVVEKFGENNPETVQISAQIEEEFITRVDKFLKLNEEHNQEKLELLDWFLEYLTQVDKVDIDEIIKLLSE